MLLAFAFGFRIFAAKWPYCGRGRGHETSLGTAWPGMHVRMRSLSRDRVRR